MIEQLFVVLTEIFPFFDNGTVRQVAHAVFATVFVFFDFGFTALFEAEFGSRIGHADRRFLLFRSGAGSQSSCGCEAEDNRFDHGESFI